jgi:ribosomal 30S subunit maturation factor RimM
MLLSPEAEEDEPYLRDLIGLAVYHNDGSFIGILEDVTFSCWSGDLDHSYL